MDAKTMWGNLKWALTSDAGSKPEPKPPEIQSAWIETSRPTATRAAIGWFTAGPFGALLSLAFPKRERIRVK